MGTSFDTRFEQPEHDGRAVDEMLCQRDDCAREAVTWCPLCEKLLCRVHDELTPRRMHDCLGAPADEAQ